MLLINTIALAVAFFAIAILFVLLVRAEYKLAQHDDSFFFRRNDND